MQMVCRRTKRGSRNRLRARAQRGQLGSCLALEPRPRTALGTAPPAQPLCSARAAATQGAGRTLPSVTRKPLPTQSLAVCDTGFRSQPSKGTLRSAAPPPRRAPEFAARSRGAEWRQSLAKARHLKWDGKVRFGAAALALSAPRRPTRVCRAPAEPIRARGCLAQLASRSAFAAGSRRAVCVPFWAWASPQSALRAARRPRGGASITRARNAGVQRAESAGGRAGRAGRGGGARGRGCRARARSRGCARARTACRAASQGPRAARWRGIEAGQEGVGAAGVGVRGAARCATRGTAQEGQEGHGACCRSRSRRRFERPGAYF